MHLHVLSSRQNCHEYGNTQFVKLNWGLYTVYTAAMKPEER